MRSCCVVMFMYYRGVFWSGFSSWEVLFLLTRFSYRCTLHLLSSLEYYLQFPHSPEQLLGFKSPVCTTRLVWDLQSMRRISSKLELFTALCHNCVFIRKTHMFSLRVAFVFKTRGKRIISLLHSQLHHRMLSCFGWTKGAFLFQMSVGIHEVSMGKKKKIKNLCIFQASYPACNLALLLIYLGNVLFNKRGQTHKSNTSHLYILDCKSLHGWKTGPASQLQTI